MIYNDIDAEVLTTEEMARIVGMVYYDRVLALAALDVHRHPYKYGLKEDPSRKELNESLYGKIGDIIDDCRYNLQKGHQLFSEGGRLIWSDIFLAELMIVSIVC